MYVEPEKFHGKSVIVPIKRTKVNSKFYICIKYNSFMIMTKKMYYFLNFKKFAILIWMKQTILLILNMVKI